MDFAILGPLEVRDGGVPVPVRGVRQRVVLAVLLLHANEFVARDRLTDAVWSQRAPADAAHALDVQMSRLRSTLGGDRVTTHSGGYSLRVEDGELDLQRFEELRARAAGAGAEAAAALLREALALWRGAPLADLADDGIPRAELAHLEEARLVALDERIDADLELGRHRALVPDLDALVALHPYREHYREAQMLALYRSGRQADALAAYEAARRTLRDDLGLEPGDALRRLHGAILRQDPALVARPAAGSPAETAAARPRPGRPTIRRRVVLAGATAAVLAAAGGGAIYGTRSHADVPQVGTDGAPVQTASSVALTSEAAAASPPVTARAAASPAIAASDGDTLEVALPQTQAQVAFVDVTTGRVLDRIPMPEGVMTGGGGMSLAAGAGSYWLAIGGGLLMEIDAHSHRVVQTATLGIEPASIAVGAGWVWVTDANAAAVLRIDPDYPQARTVIRLPSAGAARRDSSGQVAVGQGAVWVAHGGARVTRIDPVSGRVVASIDLPLASAVAVGDGAVWAVSGERGDVVRIDPATNTVVARAHLEPYVCCVAVASGYVWAMNRKVWKLSPEGEILGSQAIEGDGANLSAAPDALWVAEGISGKVTRVDPQTDAVRSLHVGGLVLVADVREGVAAVVTDVLPASSADAVDGPVLHVAMNNDQLQPLDLAIGDPAIPISWRSQLAEATCASLGDGAPPTWSADGRTATFRVTSGLRFSPPSNAPVTARTFAATLERSLAPGLGPAAVGPGLLRDVVGLGAYRAGRSAHVAGIRARGDTIAVTLRRPAGDLRARLSAAPFCAVPEGTPVVRNGIEDKPIPAAGAYYLATHLGGTGAVLLANPNYPHPTPAGFAAIEYTMAVPTAQAVPRIERGDADYVSDWDPSLAPGSPVARRLGRAAEGGERRYVRTPLPATEYLVLRTTDGPFADARVRQAARLALDRRALAAAADDLIAPGLLPPALAAGGAAGGDVVPAADRAAARALLRGDTRHATMAVCANPICAQLGRIVQRDLSAIGIDVRLVHVDDPTAAPARRADIALGGTAAPYRDALAFLARVLRDPIMHAPPEVARAVVEAAGLRDAPRDAAARALAARLEADAGLIAYGTPALPELFSARVGCRSESGAFGVRLASLCVRPDADATP